MRSRSVSSSPAAWWGTTTAMPASSMARTTAAPSAPAPPVTIATLPSSVPIFSLTLQIADWGKVICNLQLGHRHLRHDHPVDAREDLADRVAGDRQPVV